MVEIILNESFFLIERNRLIEPTINTKMVSVMNAFILNT